MRAALGLALLASLAGCGGVECGEGTFQRGNDCVGFDPNDKTAPVPTIMPPGRRSRDPIPSVAVIATDEPATIFVTTDGSDPDPTGPGEPSPVTVVDIQQGMTIKFVAVDRAGNQSEIQNATYDSDTLAPAGVQGLSVTVTGNSATVAWTNPTDADFAGTVLARVGELVDADPEPGTLVTAPFALSPSLQVVQAGTTATFIDPGLATGPVRYVAWTFDDLGNYSQPVAVRSEVPAGSLAVQFTFAGALAQPIATPALDMTGTTASLSGTTLTLNLSIKNLTTKYFQNPKAEVTSTTNATFASASGTADGLPFAALGPTALAPNATVARQLTFTGVAGSATINLTIAGHPSLMSAAGQNNQHAFVDAGSFTATPSVATTALGPNNRPGRIRPSVFVGEHFVDVPTTHGSIERFDVATGLRVTGTTISGGADGRANVLAVVASSARELAVVKLAGKRDAGQLVIVRFDEALHETGRLELALSDNRGFSRPAVSPDGTVLAVPVVGGIALVDIQTMTLLDADPATVGDDVVDPGFSGLLRQVVFADADTLVAMSRQEGKASILRRTAGVFALAKLHAEPLGTRGHSIAVTPDRRIWLSFDSGLRVYDPATDTVTNSAYPNVPTALKVLGGQLHVVRNNKQTTDVVGPTGAVLRTFTLPGQAVGHWLEASAR